MYLRIYDRNARRAIYDRIAEQTRQAYRIGLPVKVYFFERDTAQKLVDAMGTVDGCANLFDACYEIGLRQDLKLGDELATLAHELAHIIAGDVQRIARTQQSAADALAAQAMKGQDPAYLKKERLADELATRLLRLWESWGVNV